MPKVTVPIRVGTRTRYPDTRALSLGWNQNPIRWRAASEGRGRRKMLSKRVFTLCWVGFPQGAQSRFRRRRIAEKKPGSGWGGRGLDQDWG